MTIANIALMSSGTVAKNSKVTGRQGDVPPPQPNLPGLELTNLFSLYFPLETGYGREHI